MSVNTSKSILNLSQLLQEIDKSSQENFNRIYRWYVREGSLKLPASIENSVREKLGSCESQKIVRITNKYTLESTLFNEIRARRPIDARPEKENTEKTCDSFCNPLEKTPEDCFGRIFGKHCITASNIAKYDYVHGLIIFNEHEPFVDDPDKLSDFFSVAEEWFKRAVENYPDAKYPLLLWNCQWRAGASIVHGHMQLLLTHEPYARYESYIRASEKYKEDYNRDYFIDLVEVHNALGLSIRVEDISILSYLTPSKEKELFVIASRIQNLPTILSRILKFYKKLGVNSFNMALFMPPIGESSSMPNLLRVVDRGPLNLKISDIGSMELLAGTSVVTADPFKISEILKKEIVC